MNENLKQSEVLVMTRRCPICDSEKYRVIRSVDRWKVRQDGQDVAKCQNCGFVYVCKGHHYTYDYNTGVLPETPIIKKRHFHIKRLLDSANIPRFQNKISIVEVGSGTGGLAKIISTDPDYDYLGFEPNTQRAKYCQSKGLEVREEYFSANKLNQQISGIVMDNVLEHVDNPLDLIRQGAEVLPRGGIMIVIVPNLQDLRQLNPSWRDTKHWITHIHINYFTARDLKNILQDCNISFNFFNSNCLSLPNDWPFLLRTIPDSLGIHTLGLNCYGFKQ